MRPMSEEVNLDVTDSNSPLNSEVKDETETSSEEKIEGEDIGCVKASNEEIDKSPKENKESSVDVENVEHQDCVESAEQRDSFESVEAQDSVERQDSVENVKHQSSPEEIERQSSIEIRDRQSSIESKSHPSTWSFSQWSENYESLDDERPIEDLDGDPQKLILWAAEKNELETMRKLLEEDPNLVNTRDNDLYTPLHRASYSNNIEVIKLLLSYDADISSKTADEWQALHCACKWDSVEAVSLLLQNGADVNAQTKGHITPLHLAASNVSGRRTLELLLWQPYIDPNVKTDGGDTAYDIACRTGPLGALFEILEESVNIY